jgi:hypothetical protein
MEVKVGWCTDGVQCFWKAYQNVVNVTIPVCRTQDRFFIPKDRYIVFVAGWYVLSDRHLQDEDA